MILFFFFLFGLSLVSTAPGSRLPLLPCQRPRTISSRVMHDVDVLECDTKLGEFRLDERAVKCRSKASPRAGQRSRRDVAHAIGDRFADDDGDIAGEPLRTRNGGFHAQLITTLRRRDDQPCALGDAEFAQVAGVGEWQGVIEFVRRLRQVGWCWDVELDAELAGQTCRP